MQLINFSVIAEPLTNLLGKTMRFKWTSDCQNAFNKLKAILRSKPVLLAPNFDKEFVCVEVLRPSQPNGVMSSTVSLPSHMFTGQA